MHEKRMGNVRSPAKDEHTHSHKQEQEGELLVAALHSVSNSLHHSNKMMSSHPYKQEQEGELLVAALHCVSNSLR
jgi:hypothetical protein